MLTAFTLGVPVQILMIRASRGADMITPNPSVSNSGNALGAHVGGLSVAAGLGYSASTWAGLALVITGLRFAAIFRLAARPGTS